MTIKTLMRLANERRAVVWLNGKHMGAAWVLNMPFWRVLGYLPKLRPYKKAK